MKEPGMSRFKLWRDWSKHSLNHPLYKFLVLVGLAHSPSFEMHYSVRDEKPKEKYTIRWGWYITYLLMVCVNSTMCCVHGFDITTWQHWVYFWILVLCFVSGASYRKEVTMNIPENFINKMAHFVAFCHSRADAYHYSMDPIDRDMEDYFMTRCDAARDICTMFECTSEVWAEAKKIYDFTNSGREGYTLRDGKIVKVEEVIHG